MQLENKAVFDTGLLERKPGLLRRKRFLIAGLVAALAMSYLGFVAFKGAATYYLTVDEFLTRPNVGAEENVRLMGKVVEGSVTTDKATNTIRFQVAGDSGRTVPVVYTGIVPDAFKQGSDVVMEGSLASGGTFTAGSLLVKCPSKYEGTQEGESN